MIGHGARSSLLPPSPGSHISFYWPCHQTSDSQNAIPIFEIRSRCRYHADTVQYSIAPPYESTHGILYDPPRHDAPMDDFDAEVIFLDRTKHLFFISLYLRSRARESSRCAAVGISAVRRREACAYFVYILCLLCTRTVQVVSWLQSVRDYQSTSIGRLSPPLLAWQPVVFQGGEYSR
jgi:hypothetical protein